MASLPGSQRRVSTSYLYPGCSHGELPALPHYQDRPMRMGCSCATLPALPQTMHTRMDTESPKGNRSADDTMKGAPQTKGDGTYVDCLNVTVQTSPKPKDNTDVRYRPQLNINVTYVDSLRVDSPSASQTADTTGLIRIPQAVTGTAAYMDSFPIAKLLMLPHSKDDADLKPAPQTNGKGTYMDCLNASLQSLPQTGDDGCLSPVQELSPKPQTRYGRNIKCKDVMLPSVSLDSDSAHLGPVAPGSRTEKSRHIRCTHAKLPTTSPSTGALYSKPVKLTTLDETEYGSYIKSPEVRENRNSIYLRPVKLATLSETDYDTKTSSNPRKLRATPWNKDSACLRPIDLATLDETEYGANAVHSYTTSPEVLQSRNSTYNTYIRPSTLATSRETEYDVPRSVCRYSRCMQVGCVHTKIPEKVASEQTLERKRKKQRLAKAFRSIHTTAFIPVSVYC